MVRAKEISYSTIKNVGLRVHVLTQAGSKDQLKTFEKMAESNESKNSYVDHPSHYHSDSGIEVIDAIEAWGLGFSLGNCVKYISRAGHKRDARLNDNLKMIEDLEKALWYLKREIERLKIIENNS